MLESLDVGAPCKKDCDNKWKLIEYNVSIQFAVHLRAAYGPPPCDVGWVGRAELDHIEDYINWAKTTGRALATQIEKQQQPVRGCPEFCVN